MQKELELKFLADMGISYSTVEWLREQGYDTKHLRDEGLQKLSDDKIIIKAKDEGRIILACDLDFGDLMAASKDIFPSIIIFRLHNLTSRSINHQIEKILPDISTELIKGSVIIVEENRYRIRKLPI